MVDQYSPPEREAEGQMLMNRRSFLAGVSGATLLALLAGCQRASIADLRLAMLVDSVPAQLLRAFQQLPEQGGSIAVTPQDSLVGLYGLLQRWHRQTETSPPPPLANWVSLADYWLAPAIRQGLVQPVDVSPLTHWDDLAPLWLELVRRNSEGMPTTDGQTWGVPYRWSYLVVLYDPTRLPKAMIPLTAWSDLLRPELARRIILPDHPRLVLGLAQKALGASANGEEPGAIAGLNTFLSDLHRQVRAYDSDHYLETLIVGDATAVVAWSDDVLPLLGQYRQLAVAVPTEGTLLSAQLWVQPQALEAAVPLGNNWLDFCLGADFANQLAIFGNGTSPLFWGLPPDQLPEPLRRSPRLVLPQEVANQSEFLLPLTPAAADRYTALWTSLRS